MKNKFLILLSILSIVTIQNCTTTEKVDTDKQNMKATATENEAIYKEVQTLKSMLGHAPDNTATAETNKIEQPLEFGISVSKVQEMFPAPGRFEYDPKINKKVTMLARDSGGGRFTFFFYEDKLYKIIIISKWSNLTIKYAEDDIKKTEAIFIEGNGEPDLVEQDEAHKKMVWLRDDLEITLEEFNLMSHQGIIRVMSLMYTDRNISPLAKSYESFELHKTNQSETLDR
ncbi:MAG: hypothetical protein ACYSTS_04800 [Planctomycetota bacterium]|jgi:hypothetical protein